jgi:hypothetical protein
MSIGNIYEFSIFFAWLLLGRLFPNRLSAFSTLSRSLWHSGRRQYAWPMRIWITSRPQWTHTNFFASDGWTLDIISPPAKPGYLPGWRAQPQGTLTRCITYYSTFPPHRCNPTASRRRRSSCRLSHVSASYFYDLPGVHPARKIGKFLADCVGVGVRYQQRGPACGGLIPGVKYPE